MGTINPQAQELNDIIANSHPAILNCLSEKGKSFFFPKSGIVKQAGDAKGKKINATIGIALENDGLPVRLKSIADRINLEPGEVFPYAPSYGKPELRKIWQQLIRKKNPSLNGTISLPVVTNALTHGLSVAGMLFVNPGDKIISPDKFWGNYRLIFEKAYDGSILPFNTFTTDGFDVKSFENTLNKNPGKQIIILNFPNNPSGYTPANDEVDTIVNTILKSAENGNEIVVLTDDAYFGLVYEEGIFTESIFARLAHLHKNILAVKLDGATKEDYVWGLRVGFITFASKDITPEACKALEDKAGGVVRGTISNDSNLSQSLILHALNSPNYLAEKAEKYELLKQRYETTVQILKDNQSKFESCFSPLPFNSGYFMCIELVDGLDAEEIRQILLKKYDTGVIAIGNLLRVAFSSVPTDMLAKLFENIYEACQEAA